MVTVFPSLSAVGRWEEVLLFSMDFTVSQNVFEFVLQDAHFCLKKLALAFLTACVYLVLKALKKLCRKPRLLQEQISEHKSELGLATVDGPGCACTFPDIISSNTIRAWQRTWRALQC